MSLSCTLRVRMGEHDVHYAGGLVSGARVMELFGDAATEILIRHDGDEGLFRAYSSVDFLAPIHAGDYLEVTATLKRVGKTSRDIEFVAKKIITNARNPKKPSKANVLKKAIIVATAKGTCVVP